MRIMIDANIIVSAVLFPGSITSKALTTAMKEHHLLICTYVLDEVSSVFTRKFPDKIDVLNNFLLEMSYESCNTPMVDDSTPAMRDNDDRPILQAAVNAKADAILTGDKDFHALRTKYPVIISPSTMLTL